MIRCCQPVVKLLSQVGPFRYPAIRSVYVLALLFGSLFPSVMSTAQDGEIDPEVLTQQARQAVGDRSWYDPEQDQLRPVPVESRSDDTMHRDSRWLPKPKKLREAPPPSGSQSWGPLSGLRNFFGVFASTLSSANIFAWLVLILLVAILVALLVYAYSRIDQQPDLLASTKPSADDGEEQKRIAERIEQLPKELQPQTTDLRGAAEHWMQQGKFDQAIILLFAHQLLLMDRRQLIRLSRGKTNRQYLNEARSLPEARSLLRETVDAFEASYFGRHPLSGQRFAELWDANQRLEQMLAAHHEAVA